MRSKPADRKVRLVALGFTPVEAPCGGAGIATPNGFLTSCSCGRVGSAMLLLLGKRKRGKNPLDCLCTAAKMILIIRLTQSV